MGLILFSTYYKDLAANIPCTDICKFTDYVTFVNIGADSVVTMGKTTLPLHATEKWFATNKLLMKNDKTQMFTFSTKMNSSK